MASGAVHDCGTRLWDLTTFKQLATLPTGSTPSIRFHPTDGSLITSSDRGLLKWPIERHTKHASERLVIGPPVPLGNRSEMRLSSMDMSPNGNFFAAETADLNRAIVIDRCPQQYDQLVRRSQSSICRRQSRRQMGCQGQLRLKRC